MTIVAESIDEVQDAVRVGERLLPVGGGTKPALCTPTAGTTALDVSALRGLVQYDPAELTLTALAGTPVAEIRDALAPHGQYLPFDPPWAAGGATLGGTVAAGVSGPSAFRHGGVRDFVLALRFVDGMGRLVGGGAQVVKNAAGFDLPKLFVGSAGRLGVIVQLTVKVLPAPVATATVVVDYGNLAQALATMARLARGPIDIDALDLEPPGRLVIRLGGDPAVLPARTARLISLADGDRPTSVTGEDDARLWQVAADLQTWPSGDHLIRVPVTAHDIVALQSCVQQHGGQARYSLGANVAWISWPETAGLQPLDDALHVQGLAGSVLRGPVGAPIHLGQVRGGDFATRIRSALDPESRFAKA